MYYALVEMNNGVLFDTIMRSDNIDAIRKQHGMYSSFFKKRSFEIFEYNINGRRIVE